MGKRSAGWYPDPVTVGAARYRGERGWTDLVAWGGVTRHDPTPLHVIERREAQAETAIVSDYLADAARRGVVSRGVAAALIIDVEQRAPGTVAAARPATSVPGAASDGTPGPVTRPVTARTSAPVDLPPPTTTTPAPTAARPAPLSTPPAPVRPPIPEPAAPEPIAVRPPIPEPAAPEPIAAIAHQPRWIARWLGDARQAVRTDLALHGIAYLGVLLLFAGVTGLIAFSFGEVAPWVRSLAELLVPSALFLSAWYLARRGAQVVAASLTLLGGAITPIVAAASLTDGAPLPPDLGGRALPIAQGIAVAAVAIVMVVVVRRTPASPLRFLAGPVMWMAAGLAAGAARDPIPAGYEAARPDSVQLAVILAAMVATVVLCSWRRAPRALARSTRAVALPLAGVVYVLELVLAGDEGWPLASTILSAVAVLTLLELMTERLPALVTSSLQFLVVAVSAARVSAHAAPEWVALGAGVSLLAIAEYAGWRRQAKPVESMGLVLAGAAFLLTLTEPAAAAVAFGVVTVWGTWRHVAPASWLPITDDFGFVPAVAAVVTTAELWDLSARGPAIVVTSMVILLLALAGRLWRPITEDVLWRWFVPTAAAALTAVSATFPWGDLPGEVAAASAMSAAALVLSALPIAARAWLVAATVVWSLANIAEGFTVGRDAQAIALAAAALMLLLGSLAAARPICVHLASIGHAGGLAALTVASWPGWTATFVMAAATAGFWATTIVDERSEAVHLAALRTALMAGVPPADAGSDAEAGPMGVDELAPLLSLVGLWVTAMLVVDAAGWIMLDDPWMAATSAGAALLGATIIRIVPWRRARRRVLEGLVLLLAGSAALAAASSVGADRDHWSPVVSIALTLAVVLGAKPPRPLAFVWTGWFVAGALSLYVADRLGLDRQWTDVALAGWGAAVLIGGLAVQRIRHGPVPPGRFVRDRLLLPPIVLGASAFVTGGTLGLTDGSAEEIGWTSVGLSAVVLAVAVLLPLGALVALAEVLATTSYVLLAPWEPLERTWTFGPWTLLLLGAALATRRAGDWSAARWDLPSFAVAHAVAGLALVAAAGSGEPASTYAVFGGMSVATSAVIRRWPWAAAGGLLVLVAGVDAGGGWLALVLLAEGVALTVVGLLRTRVVRWTLLGLGATSLVGAWFDLAAWQSWSLATVYYATMPAAAGVALVAAAGVRGVRWVRVPHELAGVWAIAGGSVSLATGMVGIGEVDRLAGGLLFAGSLLVLAVAAGATADAVGAGMRWAAAGLAAAAWAPAAWAVEVSATAATLTGTAIGLGGIGAVLAAHGDRPSSPWIRPGAFYGVSTQIAAGIAAFSVLPDTDLLIVVLLAVAIELVALGVLTDRPELYVLSPIPALWAWLLYAWDALAGDANWFTVPIGLTVLVMVGLVRWIRRGRGGDATGYDVVAVEFVGMSFLVGAALARTLAGDLWNGVLAVGIGVLVAGWGAMTRVRRRAAFGAVATVLAVVLLIGVPLSESVTWRGPTLWLTLSVIGISAILVASALERGRGQVRRVAQRFDEMTEDWERIRFRPDGGLQGNTTPAERDEPSDEPHLVG